MATIEADWPETAGDYLAIEPELVRRVGPDASNLHLVVVATTSAPLANPSGERTTGTYSPKSLDFLADTTAKDTYRQWRDSYVTYDPDKAKAILDKIGVVDSDGDGMREMPDGSKLVIRLDYPAGTSHDYMQKNDFFKPDWERIALATKINPVPPHSWAAPTRLLRSLEPSEPSRL